MKQLQPFYLKNLLISKKNSSPKGPRLPFRRPSAAHRGEVEALQSCLASSISVIHYTARYFSDTYRNHSSFDWEPGYGQVGLNGSVLHDFLSMLV